MGLNLWLLLNIVTFSEPRFEAVSAGSDLVELLLEPHSGGR